VLDVRLDRDGNCFGLATGEQEGLNVTATGFSERLQAVGTIDHRHRPGVNDYRREEVHYLHERGHMGLVHFCFPG
jgi:hypothetical protein